jgi:hypothetical protein
MPNPFGALPSEEGLVTFPEYPVGLEALQYFDVEEADLLAMLSSGELPHWHSGVDVVFDPGDLDRALVEQRVTPIAPRSRTRS